MPQLALNQPPPPDYYAENLRRVLHHVRAFYGDLLTPEECAFAERIESCSSAAQRLFARLIGRRGPWIRVDKLNYSEVAHRQRALDELAAAQLVTVNSPAPADALLGLLTNDERARLFPVITAASKPQWIERCVSRYCDAHIAQRMARDFPWVYVREFALFKLYQLLFFGDAQQDMATFVLQDLGILTYESYDLNHAHRQFSDRVQLDRYLAVRALSGLSYRLDEAPSLAQTLVAGLASNAETRLEQRVRDRALNRIGRWHEQRAEFHAALDCYSRSSRHPARERATRLLHRLGDEAGAASLLSQIRAAPRCADEEDFAGRFGTRQRSRSSIATTECRLAGAVAPGDIERIAIDVLTAQRGRGWHLENRFSLGLAGLAFWPVVFADVPGAFVNPYQTGPVDLDWPDFLEPRRAILDAHLGALGDAFADVVRDTWTQKQGIANRLVSWAHFDAELLDAVLNAIPAAALLRLAQFVIANLHRLRTGFPDLLLVYGPGEYEFVEVKGPTDQLQPAQRIWFKVLQELQLPARVVKFKT